MTQQTTDIVARLREWSAADYDTSAVLRRNGEWVADVPWVRHATALHETVLHAADEITRLRRGWLRVIQMENACPETGGGCLAKRCGCVAEMEMLANERV
jgi:hypothetical protein